jgi:hypothetical protein
MKRRTPKTGLLLYILLNIVVSAATTLAVLSVWDRTQRQALPPFPTFEAPAATLPAVEPTAEAAESVPVDAPPTAAPGEPQIEISAVVGATDPELEYVLLKRLGEGDLNLAGWSLSDEQDNRFTFPEQPALVLFAGGAVQVYTGSGTDTPTEMYWNRVDPVWEPGEWVVLRDAQGSEQSRYQIP